MPDMQRTAQISSVLQFPLLTVNTINSIEQFTDDAVRGRTEAEDGGLLGIQIYRTGSDEESSLADGLPGSRARGNIRQNMEMNILRLTTQGGVTSC